METVFVVFLPFFGVTVSVTRHVPFLSALTLLPDNLHTAFDDEATTALNLAPEGTVTTYFLAIAESDTDFPTERNGAETTGAGTGDEPEAD